MEKKNNQFKELETPKEVFDFTDIGDLDKAIKTTATRETLVKSMRKTKKKKKEFSDELDFMRELWDYWYLYVILFVSALFTGTLGVYMGLSPYRDGNDLVFHTDPMHLALAVIYAIAFVTLTEFAFAMGKRLYFTREENNKTQSWTSFIVMAIAGISIFLTGVTGGQVIASQIDFLTVFVTIPEAAQRWVVTVIPALLTIYAFLLTGYHLSSDKAASIRMTKQLRDEKELDSETRRKMVSLAAEEAFEQAELKTFIEAIKAGRLSRENAMKAIKNGWSLQTLESFLGTDVNGDGIVAYAADTDGLPNSQSQ